jgi:predicted RNA-binding Zn ribbon-like protein
MLVTGNGSMKPVIHNWIAGDIVGGNSALNLVNTVSGWGYEPEDWVPDIESFLAWARLSGLLDEGEKKQVARLAEGSSAAAGRVLASVKELRFALWSLMTCLQQRKPAKPGDLSVINEWIRRLALAEQVVVERNKIEVAIKRDIPVLELVGLRVTAAALALLKNPPAGRIKTCPGENCGWKFVDLSKNRSRRWCDMAVCGNLVKAREYRARQG